MDKPSRMHTPSSTYCTRVKMCFFLRSWRHVTLMPFSVKYFCSLRACMGVRQALLEFREGCCSLARNDNPLQSCTVVSATSFLKGCGRVERFRTKIACLSLRRCRYQGVVAQVIVLIRADSSDIMSVIASPTARPAMVGSYGGYGQLLKPTDLTKINEN